jgi:hypothetical protein
MKKPNAIIKSLTEKLDERTKELSETRSACKALSDELLRCEGKGTRGDLLMGVAAVLITCFATFYVGVYAWEAHRARIVLVSVNEKLNAYPQTPHTVMVESRGFWIQGVDPKLYAECQSDWLKAVRENKALTRRLKDFRP